MILDIAYFGNPILRKKADPIPEITPEIKILAQNMIETMYHYNGIGLAAPQVKQSIRLFVTCAEKEDENGEVHFGPPRIFINPILKSHSATLVEAFEGCISIPKVRGPVIRPYSVIVEAIDLEGNAFSQEFFGYIARLMMHENDHLNGVLFLDRMKMKLREKLEPALREIKKQYNS